VSPEVPAPSIVIIGGGHGCSRSLAALRWSDARLTAVVTVADDGGSSGRLRRDHHVVALGDLRMAMLALASQAEDRAGGVAALARHRFADGELAGHSLGNLLLLGLIEQHGGRLDVALEAFAGLVGAVGTVLPATLEPVTLRAETAGGTVSGQAAVATARRIHRVQLQPREPLAAPGVTERIAGADLVLLGPGSLYTSILPVLLVPGIADALRATPARVVLVGNMREQRGETEGMGLADHVDALLQHIPGLRLDVLLAHERPAGGAGAPEGLRPLRVDESSLLGSVAEVVRRDLGDEMDGHDPERLAGAVDELLERRRSDGPPQ
jgi:uncharacterized cofD-like protein